MTIIECIDTDQLSKAWPIMSQLRDHISLEEFLSRAAAARQEGYRLFALESGGRLVGAMGCRLVSDLASGRSLYVDDLVVDGAERSGGHGRALIEFAKGRAAAERCDAIRLTSNFHRTRAHAFYEREGFDRTGYSFKFTLTD